jgi:dTDP-4-amino-4,6-dideoxygalactose transaminase
MSRKLYEETFSLPIYPALSEGDIHRIVAATKSIFAGV